MNQKETICPYAPMYHIYDFLPKSGRAVCICEITFPVAAESRSIFCHKVYKQSPITANNMFNELLPMCMGLLLLPTCMQN